jgi:hypothetical protein
MAALSHGERRTTRVSEVILQQKPVTEGQVPEVQEESRFLA